MPKRCDRTLTSYTFKIYRGLAFARAWKFKNPDGTPIDLTGKIVRLGIKDVFDSTLKLSSDEAPNTYGSFIEITDAASGEFRFVIADEETELADTGEGRWWLELEDNGFPELLWLDIVIVEDI